MTAPTSRKTSEQRSVSATGGMKGVKEERYDLIPVEPLRKLSILFHRGALKYSDRNWENGYDWSKSYAALQRHSNAFWGGEDFDAHGPECEDDCNMHMELPHTVCIMFHSMVLTEFMETHPEYDDRPKRTV